MLVRQDCAICKHQYSTEYRNWYDRYIPWVCSSACYTKMLRDAVLGNFDFVNPEADTRIAKFKHSDRSFRSSYELKFSDWLDRQELHYEYEPYVFTLRNGSRYVPDFYIEKRVFVEVKGLWNSESKKKFKAMIDEFFGIPLVVADKEFLDMLARTEKTRGRSR